MNEKEKEFKNKLIELIKEYYFIDENDMDELALGIDEEVVELGLNFKIKE